MQHNSSDREDDGDAAFWVSYLVNTVTYVVMPFTFVVGTVGNILALKVLVQPRYTRTSTGVYMIALEIFDVFVITLFLPVLFVRIVFQEVVVGDAFCQFYVFLVNVTPLLSNNTLALMSLDRVIVVTFPLRAKSICTTYKAKLCLVILVFVVIGFSIYRTIPIQMFINSTGKDCDSILVGSVRVITANIQIALQVWVPFLVILVCNVIIVFGLISSAQQRKLLQGPQGSTSSSSGGTSLTVMLVVVSVVFLLLHIPVVLHRLLRDIHQSGADAITLNALYWAARALMCLNSAINFFLYMLSSKQFRSSIFKHNRKSENIENRI
ncbi:growth hormone secretagogue receptor type 1-like [Tubulanus polymorphus]|uniref:growth hormone secretagogue receptor type 1-like n=1 Tax=Tubulanus polymorphus TaxID=672921 RepID=UPI003DA5D3BF